MVVNISLFDPDILIIFNMAKAQLSGSFLHTLPKVPIKPGFHMIARTAGDARVA